jgi:serine/threonine-protein kinase HipA
LLGARGWQLSPAYDINPDENGMGLKLNISENDNSLDFDLALSVAKYFGLPAARASAILDEVQTAVAEWPPIATRLGIPRSEQEMIARAFR